MKKFIKRNKENLLSFFTPIVIMLLIYIFNKIYPFGNKVVAMIDGYSQYPGMLANFINIFKGNSNLFYSLKGLFGFNSFANSIYYCLNITNIFAFLFDNLMKFYNFIVVIKIGLCSLTTNIFLNYIKKNKYSWIFSICYGLSAYNLLYYYNYMWFDTIIILPLVIMGIEKIFKEDNYSLYLIFLSLSIIFNFYIGYMVCIFSVLYFIYKTIIHGFNLKRTFKYILFSILSGLISAVFLVPVILELLNGKAALYVNYKNELFNFDYDFISAIYKLTFASFSNGDLEYGNPNIYVSVFVLINSFFYFFNSKISLKERLASLGIILFLLISMSFNFLDFAWHMFQKPIFYPVRYGFIFDLFIIKIAYQNFIKQDKIKILKKIILYIILSILIIIGFYTAGNTTDTVNLTAKLIYLAISFLFIIYYALIMEKEEIKKFVIILIITELIFNSFLSIKNNGSTTNMKEFKETYEINKYYKDNIVTDEPIIRVATNPKINRNNGLMMGFNELALFTSVRNSKPYRFAEEVLNMPVADGCNSHYHFNSPIVNAFANIKYIGTKNELNYYNKIKENIYLNNDVSSIGFMVSEELLKEKITDSKYQNFNNFINTISNTNEISITKLVPIEANITCNSVTSSCIIYDGPGIEKYHITANHKQFIYINDTNSKKNKYHILLNNKEILMENKEFVLLNKNDQLDISIEYEDQNKTYLVEVNSLNYNSYQRFVNAIKENPIKITNYQNDSNFSGTIDVKKDGLLLMSIANDNGWKVYVDGKKTDIENVYDNSLIAIKLKQGKHTIDFKYQVPGLKEGLIITIISLGISIIILNKKH